MRNGGRRGRTGRGRQRGRRVVRTGGGGVGDGDGEGFGGGGRHAWPLSLSLSAVRRRRGVDLRRRRGGRKCVGTVGFTELGLVLLPLNRPMGNFEKCGAFCCAVNIYLFIGTRHAQSQTRTQNSVLCYVLCTYVWWLGETPSL